MRKKLEFDSCEINSVFNLFGKKWTTLILKEILKGNNHYGNLNRTFANMSSKTLALRLKVLEKNGIISKKIYPVIPPSVEYNLTKKGMESKAIFNVMYDWKNKWRKK